MGTHYVGEGCVVTVGREDAVAAEDELELSGRTIPAKALARECPLEIWSAEFFTVGRIDWSQTPKSVNVGFILVVNFNFCGQDSECRDQRLWDSVELS